MKFSAEEYYTGRRYLEYHVDEEDLEDFISYCNPNTPEEIELIESLGWEGIFAQYKERGWLSEEDAIFIKDADNGIIYSLGDLFNEWVEDYCDPVVKWTDEDIMDYTDFEVVE